MNSHEAIEKALAIMADIVERLPDREPYHDEIVESWTVTLGMMRRSRPALPLTRNEEIAFADICRASSDPALSHSAMEEWLDLLPMNVYSMVRRDGDFVANPGPENRGLTDAEKAPTVGDTP